MLSIHDLGSRLCDGLSRREWLRLGGLSAFGLSMPSLLSASSAPSSSTSFGKAKSCIVLFHLGGPPQQETWDMKPDAPAGIRGDYKPSATNVPGIQVCELMPRTAKQLDKICVLRAMSTNDNAHSSSGYWMLTGVPHAPTNSENAKPGAPNDWPCTAALVQRLRAGKNGLPASIVVPEHIWNTGNQSWPGQDGGFLGRTADPWLIHCQPHKPGFAINALTPPADVSATRMRGRLGLLQKVNRHLENLDRAGGTSAFEHKSRQALDLLAGSRGRAAFNLERESLKLRERYGMTRWGQSLLLARRLVEAGVSLVQVNWTRMEGETNESPAWDTHQKNALHLKRLMPVMDAGYSALLEDLEVRGLLDTTLIVWMGEFGRTPKINGGGGRDHWGHVFSATLAGGGVRGGQVIGSSDKIAGHPRDGRVLPQDLQATVFHCLGMDAHTEVRDTQSRPVAITRGQVIRQVV